MKNLTFLLFILSTVSIFSQESKNKINWHNDIDIAIALGKEKNQDVFIYLGEKKCVPCRAVEKYAYSTKVFQEYAKKFIMVKVYNNLDETKTKELQYFNDAKKRFNTKSVPRFIIIKNGEEIANFFAYIKSPEALIEKINSFY
ncbi:thioredoxin-like protein [Tenacibaculum lutimaris]|uniref:Thioredoxin-like protein n=1 Tax=Tenacibaculum lutimaris TaxID=285258 RepID=A0A420DY19_9FLAO|nr:thioredoxin family protein [Tenacibaculum lutimaris]RKF02724.1 thioredoxin-like protein [Tenacibaculum lutimaris]